MTNTKKHIIKTKNGAYNINMFCAVVIGIYIFFASFKL